MADKWPIIKRKMEYVDDLMGALIEAVETENLEEVEELAVILADEFGNIAIWAESLIEEED
jgi:hypothetical protein